VDLPTYTNIWRIEKRLYKLYDFKLPMPLPINWIAVFAGITVPYIVLLVAIGLPFNHTLVWLYVLPPGLLTWLTTRPVIENKRLPELVESQVRYLAEPRVWTRLTPHNEKDQMVVTARVWHLRQAPQRRKTAKTRAAMGAVMLRERNALARRSAATTAIGDPAEGNAPLAAASALATAPATSANGRSRARARGTGPRVPAPGSSGRQRPPGRRTLPPQEDWAAQQREAAPHDEFPEETWPAGGQSPRAQATGTEDQAAKPSRFRLSPLRSRAAGQAPALPPGVALRRPAEPRRPRFDAPPPSDPGGSFRSWPGGPDRQGQAGPAWRMPAIRSAPPLGSVAAPMSSGLPAHATPDVSPASPAPDVEPVTSVVAAPGACPPSPAPPPSQSPPVYAAQNADLGALLGLASLEVTPGTPASAALHGEPATPAPVAQEADPAAQTPAAPDAEPVTSAPARSWAPAAPSASATPEADPALSPPVTLDREPALSAHVIPQVDPAAQAPVGSDVEPAISASASPDADAAPAAPEVDSGVLPAALDGEPATPVRADPAARAPADPDVEPAISAAASSGFYAAPTLEADSGTPAPVALADGPAMPAPAAPEADSGTPTSVAPGEKPATWVYVVPEVDPAAQAPAASDQAASAPSRFQKRPASPAADLGLASAHGLGNVRSTPAPAPPSSAPRVEISHDEPAQRPVQPAPVPPVNPAPAQPEPAGLSLFSAALTTETGDKSKLPADVPVVRAVADAEPLAVPSIERALSGPSKDRNLTWHGKVKIVAGTGQGPGKRDQEALDRARARLPLKTPQRVLMLGCTSGAGQSVTTLMTGHILASLREEPVAAVDLHDGTLARYSAPAGWLEDMLSGRPPQGAVKARPDGLGPTLKNVPARLDVVASRDPLMDGDELKLAAQLTRHYSLSMLDPGGAGLTKLLKIADQLVIVVPASIDGAGALADTRDWLDTHGFADLADHSVTVINGVSRRSLTDVEHAESVARGRCRAIVRVPWDDMLPAEIADPSALRPQTRVAYTALAGVLVAGMAAAPVRTSQ
jgi:TcpE family